MVRVTIVIMYIYIMHCVRGVIVYSYSYVVGDFPPTVTQYPGTQTGTEIPGGRKGDGAYIQCYTVTTRMISALRWAVM